MVISFEIVLTIVMTYAILELLKGGVKMAANKARVSYRFSYHTMESLRILMELEHGSATEIIERAVNDYCNAAMLRESSRNKTNQLIRDQMREHKI